MSLVENQFGLYLTVLVDNKALLLLLLREDVNEMKERE
jgi:hypothetical protein